MGAEYTCEDSLGVLPSIVEQDRAAGAALEGSCPRRRQYTPGSTPGTGSAAMQRGAARVIRADGSGGKIEKAVFTGHPPVAAAVFYPAQRRIIAESAVCGAEIQAVALRVERERRIASGARRRCRYSRRRRFRRGRAFRRAGGTWRDPFRRRRGNSRWSRSSCAETFFSSTQSYRPPSSLRYHLL